MGKHYMMNLYGCPFELLDNEFHLKEIITKAVVTCGATMIEVISKKFTPQGVTVLALLSESHMSIHTWPEKGEAAIDVYTCGDSRPELACDFLFRELKAEKQWMQAVDR